MRLVRLPWGNSRISYYCPYGPTVTPDGLELQRFPESARAALGMQVGPLANLRSSSGCAVMMETDSPVIEMHLARLRHHQPVPQGLACEVRQEDGSWRTFSCPDLREQGGEVTVPLATGLVPGAGLREVWVWLPLISTCRFAGLSIAEESGIECLRRPVEPRWLAIGDSLTQGFSVQCPTQNWVHRLMRRWDLPAWNLGVGGLKIEPESVEWALADRTWDLVTIALGSNHAWSEADVLSAPERAAELAELALGGGHGRVVWILPGYKPCEEGKGPPDFMGVPLNREAGERVRRVREGLRERLSRYVPQLEVVEDLAPRDARLYPDGLHPSALGFALYAENLCRALER